MEKGVDKEDVSCRTVPLRAGRSLRDGYTSGAFTSLANFFVQSGSGTNGSLLNTSA
jgi:hypothetical protein